MALRGLVLSLPQGRGAVPLHSTVAPSKACRHLALSCVHQVSAEEPPDHGWGRSKYGQARLLSLTADAARARRSISHSASLLSCNPGKPGRWVLLLLCPANRQMACRRPGRAAAEDGSLLFPASLLVPTILALNCPLGPEEPQTGNLWDRAEARNQAGED